VGAVQTSTDVAYLLESIMIRKATLALALLVLSVSPAALAQSSEPVPVPEPSTQSQNAPEAQSDAASQAVPATLAEIKTKGADAIAKRQRTLAGLAGKLALQKTDSCAYNGSMSFEVRNTSLSLSTVGASLARTTDIEEAKTLYKSIFIDHRVYALVEPKAGKVFRCNAIVERNAALTAMAVKVQATIDSQRAKGIDTSVAQANKDAAIVLVGAVNPGVTLESVMGLVPDRGVDSVRLSNASALTACDASLDAQYASQKTAHAQLVAARNSLKANRPVKPTKPAAPTAPAVAR
jgi:hypothetical protein